MKVFITLMKYLMIFIYCIFPTAKEASYTNLGIPLEAYYPEGIIARSAWDVEVYDGKLFVAAGDYDVNSGPVPIYCYDIADKKWILSGTVQDEQIEHFKIINDTLMAPGCDPKGNSDYGNIYVYEDNQWTTVRSIPGGIHQYDLIEFNGNIFAALGVLPGEYPIAISKDGGKTFHQTTMYKDGTPLDTSVPVDARAVQIRVYDFFTLNGELYAYYCRYVDKAISNEIYRYKGDGFYYYCDLPESLTARRTTYRTFDEKVEHNGKLYFTTGNLYVTSDIKTAEQIKLEKNSIVTDIRVIEDALFLITATKNEDGTYRTSLWYLQSGWNEQFRELLYFNFPCPAQSFTYHNGTMYFGMGDGTLSESNPSNGTILSVYVLG